jgi:hypothetical protein
MNKKSWPWRSTVHVASAAPTMPCACAYVEPAETTYAIELAFERSDAI